MTYLLLRRLRQDNQCESEGSLGFLAKSVWTVWRDLIPKKIFLLIVDGEVFE